MSIQSKVSFALRSLKNEPTLRLAIKRSQKPGTTPKDWFSGVSDETWLWANTSARRHRKEIADIVPGVPDEAMQANFTGQSGDATLREGFNAYRIFKTCHESHVGPLESCPAVLDFGCGWGRIIRFFLREIEPERLCGVDHSEDVIRVCRETNQWCRFSVIEPLPPTPFADQSFGLIYLYSVFSHLPEEMHWNLLHEFRRLLIPGGMLIATTLSRAFIEEAKVMREDPFLNQKPQWARDTAKAFQDTNASLSAYDQGKFCYSSLGAGGRWSFWGETCISRKYVEGRWRELFDICQYIDDPAICGQNVIVARKSH